MKNIISVLLILAVFSAQAQRKKKSKDDQPPWFNLELKGGGGTSFFTNKNISSDDQIKSNNFGFNPVFGVGFGCHIIPQLAVQIEKNWSTLSQKYTYKNNLPDRTYKLKTGDFAFLIRKTSLTGGYVGLGFKMSSVSDFTNPDSLNYFNNKFNFLLFDLGGPLYTNNIFDINLNFRFGYGLNDMVNNKDYQPGAYTTYPTYKPTSSVTIQAMLCFNWHIGYFATSQCKNKGFILFTN